MHILEASVRLKKQLNLNIPEGNLLYHSFSMTERQIIEEKNKKRRQCIQFFFVMILYCGLLLQWPTFLKGHHQLISAGVNSIVECDTLLVIVKQRPSGKAL